MKTLRQIKRIVIFVVGITVLLMGVALVVLPGPAFIVIPAGLGILAIEFEWARHWLKKARELWREVNGTGAENSNGRARWARRLMQRARELGRRALKSLRPSKG